MTIMSVKEYAIRDERSLAASLGGRERETTLVRALVENQSPVIKIWFVIMLLNMAMFLLLIH